MFLPTSVGPCARGYAFKGVDQMSQAMYRNVATAIKVMPIPQKYVDSAAAGVKAAALASVNEPARHG